jgi:hypothetical protein
LQPLHIVDGESAVPNLFQDVVIGLLKTVYSSTVNFLKPRTAEIISYERYQVIHVAKVWAKSVKASEGNHVEVKKPIVIRHILWSGVDFQQSIFIPGFVSIGGAGPP